MNRNIMLEKYLVDCEDIIEEILNYMSTNDEKEQERIGLYIKYLFGGILARLEILNEYTDNLEERNIIKDKFKQVETNYNVFDVYESWTDYFS
jgi:hypothetical protein